MLDSIFNIFVEGRDDFQYFWRTSNPLQHCEEAVSAYQVESLG